MNRFLGLWVIIGGACLILLGLLIYSGGLDRKSTRLNSSHQIISYALFFFNDTATTEIYTLSLHDALPISAGPQHVLVPYSALKGLIKTDGPLAPFVK